MNGIPVDLKLDGDVETVYFATRRFGEEGLAMREAQQRYYSLTAEVASMTQRVALLSRTGERLRPRDKNFEARVEEIHEKQTGVLRALAQAKGNLQAAAEAFVVHSLQENYGDNYKRILAALTDQQVQELVQVIENGELPEDFFPSSATQQSGKPASSGGGSGQGSSSKPGSRASKSRKAR